MFNQFNADLHQPPSSLASGRFLTLLTIQLVAVGMGLAISHHVYQVARDVIERHENLVHSRQQIDQVSEQLNSLSQAGVASAEETQQFNQVVTELAPGHFLDEIEPELPSETADVEKATDSLKGVWQAWRTGTSGLPSPHGESAGIPYAVSRLDRALDVLRSGVDRLDESNLGHFATIRQIRL